jgi:hypothetical protein
MELKKEALRLMAAVMIAILFLILMVFFPRTQEVLVYGPAGTLDFGYRLDINQYKADIVQYFQHVWRERSLGGTMFQTVVEKKKLHDFLDICDPGICSTGIRLGRNQEYKL